MRPCRQATTSYSANPRFSRVYANATNTVAMAQFKRWRGVCGIGTRICLGPGKNHLCTACVLPGLGPRGCHSRWNPSHEQSLSKPSLHATDPEPAHAARHLPGVQGRQQHHQRRGVPQQLLQIAATAYSQGQAGGYPAGGFHISEMPDLTRPLADIDIPPLLAIDRED